MSFADISQSQSFERRIAAGELVGIGVIPDPIALAEHGGSDLETNPGLYKVVMFLGKITSQLGTNVYLTPAQAANATLLVTGEQGRDEAPLMGAYIPVHKLSDFNEHFRDSEAEEDALLDAAIVDDKYLGVMDELLAQL